MPLKSGRAVCASTGAWPIAAAIIAMTTTCPVFMAPPGGQIGAYSLAPRLARFRHPGDSGDVAVRFAANILLQLDLWMRIVDVAGGDGLGQQFRIGHRHHVLELLAAIDFANALHRRHGV